MRYLSVLILLGLVGCESHNVVERVKYIPIDYSLAETCVRTGNLLHDYYYIHDVQGEHYTLSRIVEVCHYQNKKKCVLALQRESLISGGEFAQFSKVREIKCPYELKE